MFSEVDGSIGGTLPQLSTRSTYSKGNAVGVEGLNERDEELSGESIQLLQLLGGRALSIFEVVYELRGRFVEASFVEVEVGFESDRYSLLGQVNQDFVHLGVGALSFSSQLVAAWGLQPSPEQALLHGRCEGNESVVEGGGEVWQGKGLFTLSQLPFLCQMAQERCDDLFQDVLG